MASAIRLGICCLIEQAPAALDAGFDYIELPLNALADFSNPPGVRAESTNQFFPLGVSIYGPGAFDWREYSKSALERAAILGVKVAVIGSGGQRRSGAGQSMPEAEEAFIDIVAEIQEQARPYGIAIAPEALNRSETDVFNTVSHLATALGRRGLAFTFDTFHEQLQPTEADFDRLPIHVHFAGEGRRVPLADDSVWGSCIGPLISIGYSGRFSLESNAVDFGATLAESQRNMRASLQGLWI